MKKKLSRTILAVATFSLVVGGVLADADAKGRRGGGRSGGRAAHARGGSNRNHVRHRTRHTQRGRQVARRQTTQRFAHAGNKRVHFGKQVGKRTTRQGTKFTSPRKVNFQKNKLNFHGKKRLPKLSPGRPLNKPQLPPNLRPNRPLPKPPVLQRPPIRPRPLPPIVRPKPPVRPLPPIVRPKPPIVRPRPPIVRPRPPIVRPRPPICFPRHDWCFRRPRYCHWWWNYCERIRYCQPVDCISYDCSYVTAPITLATGTAVQTRWWLGINGMELPNAGLGIETVEEGSPAAQAGLAPGMVITLCNGIKIVDGAAMSAAIAKSGGVLNLTVLEKVGGEPAEVSIQMQRLAAASF